MDRTELAKEIHETAKSKGFWDKERNWGEMMMLAVSELAEALEEHRDGKPLVYYMHAEDCVTVRDGFARLVPEGMDSQCVDCFPKPEGLVIELADCIIRCYDSLQHLVSSRRIIHLFEQVERIEEFEEAIPLSDLDSEALYQITQTLCRVYGTGIPSGYYLAKAIVQCETLIKRHGHDPEKSMRAKMDYNKTREHMHGKAY